MNFVIYTENTADLPSELIQQAKLKIIPMEFILDEVVYSGKPGNTINPKELYAAMRAGKKTSTSQITPQIYIDLFSKELAKGTDVLYLAFSSGLSGSYESAISAQKELAIQFPDNKLIVVNTLSACMGEGMLVYKTALFAQNNNDINQVATYAEQLVQKVCHLFTVDDLNHLHRGGRLSKTSAVLGTLLHLKPLLHLSAEGKIVPFAKVIGRNKALSALVEKIDETIDKTETEFIMIGHGDCLEEAQNFGKKISEKTGIKTIYYNFIGTVIGSHSGPNTIAVFYMGKSRTL